MFILANNYFDTIDIKLFCTLKLIGFCTIVLVVGMHSLIFLLAGF